MKCPRFSEISAYIIADFAPFVYVRSSQTFRKKSGTLPKIPAAPCKIRLSAVQLGDSLL